MRSKLRISRNWGIIIKFYFGNNPICTCSVNWFVGHGSFKLLVIMSRLKNQGARPSVASKSMVYLFIYIYILLSIFQALGKCNTPKWSSVHQLFKIRFASCIHLTNLVSLPNVFKPSVVMGRRQWGYSRGPTCPQTLCFVSQKRIRNTPASLFRGLQVKQVL